MSYSTAAATSIIMVGLILSMSFIYTSANDSLNQVTDATQEKMYRAHEKVHGQIKINDVQYNSTMDELLINATNNGNTVFKVRDDNRTLNIILDGRLYRELDGKIESYSIEGENSNLWIPESTLIVDMNVDFKPSRVKLVTKTGIIDYYFLG